MSVLQRTIRLFVLAAMAVVSPVAFSQNGYHPSAVPMNFDPDWQFFAPVQLQDMEDLTARQRANKGFYLTYDRMNIGVTRPEIEGASYQLDWTWGNRWDFGWMKDDEKGWMFSAMNISGPNQYNIYEQHRVNYEIISPATPNPPTYDQLAHIYEIADSVNVGKFRQFEANKVWRLEPYRYGGILEPMVGLRYAYFMDYARNDTYSVIFPVANEFGDDLGQETLLRDQVSTHNHMLLGQFGFRYTKFVRRWTFSNDAKVFAGHVYQSQNTIRESINAYFGLDVAAGDDPIQEVDRRGTTYSGRRNGESTVGFDIRVEGAYKATKHLDFRAGFQMLYFGRGIWRGSTVTSQGPQFAQDQHLIMPGFTFGVALNR